jgi:hypothetical protein
MLVGNNCFLRDLLFVLEIDYGQFNHFILFFKIIVFFFKKKKQMLDGNNWIFLMDLLFIL